MAHGRLRSKSHSHSFALPIFLAYNLDLAKSQLCINRIRQFCIFLLKS